MAGKTKVDVSLDFREDKTIKLVSWTVMQRFPRKSGDVVFGNAELQVNSPTLGMQWFIEENPEAGTVRIAVRQLSIRIECQTTIRMFAGIDKASDCFKHVSAHEMKHVKLYKRSITASARKIRRTFEREKYPDLKKPAEMELREGRPFIERWIASLNSLHDDELQKASDTAKAFSDKIHTASEKRRTERFCLDCMP